MPQKQTKPEPTRLLTEVELELMTVIWDLDKASVKDVVSKLSQDRNLAYTTVATVMKVLEQKEFLQCQKDSYAHIFSPLISKSDYESACLEHMIVSVFDGEPVALVQRLLNTKKLRKEDIHAIEDALKNLGKTSNSATGRKSK